MADILPKALLLGAGGAAIVLAFAVTGGPGTGRAENRDQTRVYDLIALRQHVECMTGEGALPEKLGPTSACPATDLKLKDPLDGDYTYRVITPESYELCAKFEDPKAINPYGRIDPKKIDPETGCVIFQRH